MSLASIISLLGGLAFFLFGMTLLGEGLKRVAGSKLETILGRLTSTTLRGVLLGTLVTAVIQSSSATTVMVVGFVNSGIMQLTNAVGIIMGANVGTTATSWLLSLAGVSSGGGAFSSATVFALVAFIGIILYFFCTKTAQKNVGMILLAFSVLMSGMQSMSAAMDPLKESEAFLHIISAASNPAVALLVGLVVTAIIQSSSASIGILQALSVTGVISYQAALPMIVGMCIGACVPVLLSAIGANVNGKRAAFIYLYFNVIGAVIWMVPFYLYDVLVGFPFMAEPANSLGIAVANTIFKVVATVVLLPFAKLLEKLAVATIPEKTSEEDDGPQENYLDERFLAYPPLAIEQSARTVAQMAAAAKKNLDKSLELLSKFDQVKFDKIMSREETVDRLEDRLGNYLIQLNTRELSDAETLQSSKFLHSLTNLERISDHAVNLARLAQEMHTKGIAFSGQAMTEIHVCVEAVHEIMDLSCGAICDDNVDMAQRVEPLEETIDAITGELKARHIYRLQSGQCTLELGFIFNDCINNFERVADHCSNLAVSVIELKDSSLESHDYLRTLKQGSGKTYRRLLKEYEEKYYAQLKQAEQAEQASQESV